MTINHQQAHDPSQSSKHIKNVKTINLEHPLRILFLRAFVQELINQKSSEYSSSIQSPLSIQNNPEQTITNPLAKKDIREAIKIKAPQIQIPQRQIIARRPIMPQRQMQRISPIFANQIGPSPNLNPGIKEIQGSPMVPITNPKSDIKQDMSSIGLDKITPIILDPSVVSIECPGPDKPLLVNQQGRINATNIILKSEDIDNVMKEISTKTKIPLMNGMFKAALGNVIITALISEFLGTRFVIQKMPNSQQSI